MTLQFDDEDMERELRTGTRNASYCVLILFFILDIMCRAVFPLSGVMFDPASDKSTTVAHTCVTITYASVLVVLRHAHFLPWHEAAKIQDLLWLASWVINMTVWWAMLLCGLARRLTAAEGQGAAVVCAMWGFVMVLQHVIHIGFRPRVVVLLMAVLNALNSVAWQKELLAALMFGEAVGYSIEHMARISYLPRAKSLEDAKIAKERSDYDLRLLAHRSNRDRPNGAPSSRSIRSRSDGSWQDSAAREPLPHALPAQAAFEHSLAAHLALETTLETSTREPPHEPLWLWTDAWVVNEVQARACSLTSSSVSSRSGQHD